MHFLKKKRLSRRTLLRGSAGVTLALPVLDIMLNDNGTAFAQGGDLHRKFFLGFAGNSYDVARFSLTNKEAGFVKCAPHEANELVPVKFGSDYELTTVLKMLDYYPGLREYFTIVSNLTVPMTGDASFNTYVAPETIKDAEGRVIESKGEIVRYHRQSAHPVLFGVNFDDTYTGGYKTTSLDHIVGQAIKGQALKTQIAYSAANGAEVDKGRISLLNSEEKAYRSLDTLFNALFSDLEMNQDPAMQEQVRKERAHELFILDHVQSSRKRLLQNLGLRDQERLDIYFDEVNQIQNHIKALQNTGSLQCEKPNMPSNFGNEQQVKKMEIARDLIFLGLQCGVVNSAAAMLTKAQTRIKTAQFLSKQRYYSKLSAQSKNELKNRFDWNFDFHEVGHSSKTIGNAGIHEKGRAAIAIAYSMWAVDNFFYIANRMKETQVGSTNMLGQAGLVFTFESGVNIKPQQYVHVDVNHVMLVCGKAGGKLKTGLHIDGKDAHPASVSLAVANALDSSITKVNQVDKIFKDIQT